jgi:tRNA(adenine34) deaminase
MHSHEYYMQQAIKLAQQAFDSGEVPVGALLVANNTIISKAYNQVELLNDSTAHAEVLALTAAYAALGSKYLTEATLYVTLEPCLMCAGALYWGKVSTIVFGSYDAKRGASVLTHKSPYHERATVIGGICEAQCSQLIKDFFKAKR